ncbi:hypothetical protein B0I35DRAFT_479690 [Stachybotrys elegans]|uniref:Lysine-specific metallo-endopeptidase domain-containing protein n=1 Tax=Stachybotrys elegans TaxID=80388 RepID=A0A8K0SQE5_9HYPO|nr:hypothetical protein B0I35DRAFT_479690 [Stachybotrys elegans]
MKFFTPLLASTAFAGVSGQILKDYPLFNGGDAYWINRLNQVPVPNRWVVKREWGTAPRHCLATAADNSFCNPYDVEVYDLYYADCNAPWTVCRCNNVSPDYNIDVIADNIGRVPVRMRSWARHYSFFANNNNWKNSAYSTWTDINVFGSFPVSTILFHETCHNVDSWVTSGASGSYSSRQEWRDLANRDSCVPTDYSKSSWVEHFAEMCVQATYEENYGGIPIGTQCMSNTLTRARQLLRDAIKIVPGDKCTERIAPSPNACMGPEARNRGLCNGIPDIQLRRRDANEPEMPVTAFQAAPGQCIIDA